MRRRHYSTRIDPDQVEQAREKLGLPESAEPTMIIRYAVATAAGASTDALQDARDTRSNRRYSTA